MRQFRRIVSWFDLRHNGLVHPFINALLMWDIHCVLRLEQWQTRVGGRVRMWFSAIGEVEAISSFAGLAHDEPTFCDAEILDGPARFHAQCLGHPLISDEIRVDNDVGPLNSGAALLVTGSNMSGKSTLLRSMGLSAVMGLAGCPVCARRLTLTPVTLVTSVRVSDSLEAGVSRFYAEVAKLKRAVDTATQGSSVLFLLDEILHGTNSRERQIGARWVLSELLANSAVGAVSTHDEALCRLGGDLQTSVLQVHFQESVNGDVMSFDYKLRPGPVRSGNALRLMRTVGLDVPLE
jgi:DNA mismatch repair ATPase MutS